MWHEDVGACNGGKVVNLSFAGAKDTIGQRMLCYHSERVRSFFLVFLHTLVSI